MLAGPRTGFTQFSMLNERPPVGYTWSGKRLRKIQATSRQDDLLPDAWSNMSKNFKQKKERRHWATEKPNLDNAPKLRGVFLHRSRRHGVEGHLEKRA